MSELAAPLVGCTFLLCGSYVGKQNQNTLTATICDNGGNVSTKLTSSVTHLLISDSEWIKRGPKTRAVLEHNEDASKNRIWIVSQAWLVETTDAGVRQDENEWDLSLNADESEEEYDRLEREEKEAAKVERKRRKVEEAKEKEDGSQSETEEVPKQSTSAIEVDEYCSMADKVTLHRSKRTIWNAYLTLEADSKSIHKFYKFQILKSTSQNMFWVYTRWGRIDSEGKNQLQGPWGNEKEAIGVFEKKFKEKTKISWKDRRTAKAVDDKYTYVKPAEEEEEDFADFGEEDFAQLDDIEAQFTTSQTVQTKSNSPPPAEADEIIKEESKAEGRGNKRPQPVDEVPVKEEDDSWPNKKPRVGKSEEP